MDKNERSRIIIKTAKTDIIANVVLGALKILFGIISHSSAMIVDSINNFADSINAGITVIGHGFAGREADKQYPLGFGRIEYVSSLIVGGLLIYSGITAIVAAIKNLLDGVKPEYTLFSIIFIVIAVVAKFVMWRHAQHIGVEYNSKAMVAIGIESLAEGIISASLILSIILMKTVEFNLEPWIILIMALYLIWYGLVMIRDMLKSIIGVRADREIIQGIKKEICNEPGVYGAYNIILNYYGPSVCIGSANIEVSSSASAGEIAEITERIQRHIRKNFGVRLEAIGVYPLDISDKKTMEIYDKIMEYLSTNHEVSQFYGLVCDDEKKTMSLHLVMNFEVKGHEKHFANTAQGIRKLFPEYKVHVIESLDV